MIHILQYTSESKCVGTSIALKDNQKKKKQSRTSYCAISILPCAFFTP